MKFLDTGNQSEPEAEEKKPAVRAVLDREGLEMAQRALRDAGIDATMSLGEEDVPDQGVIPISYTKEIIGLWQIDHGARGSDYIIQMIPRRKLNADPRVIIEAFIRTLYPIIPGDVDVNINPPNMRLEIDFYTLTFVDVLKKPGAQAIMTKRVPAELGAIDAWSI